MVRCHLLVGRLSWSTAITVAYLDKRVGRWPRPHRSRSVGEAVEGFLVSTTIRLSMSTRRSVRTPSELNSSQVRALSKVARALSLGRWSVVRW